MADIATAYVQIVPSARGLGAGLSDVLGKEMPGAGQSAGNTLGTNLVGTLKRVLASAAIGEALKRTIAEGSALEQLQGGVEKIFNDMDTSVIFEDAANAYKNLNMSANEYLTTINDVGASFSATMGDAKGYEVAKTGLQAISDYASGTGKSVDVLSEKFAMITRSTSSYQSIADQFSGILPATSADFLTQAQAAGFLAGSYKKLTDVPVAEYQEAVARMLEKGTDALGLTGNTAAETATTFSGSLAAMKGALSNFLGNLALGKSVESSLKNLAETVRSFFIGNLIPMIRNIVTDIPGAMVTFINALIPSGMQKIATTATVKLSAFLRGKLPTILANGVELITSLQTGFLNGIPAFLATSGSLLTMLLDAILSALPSILTAGVTLIANFVQGLLKSAPNIISAAASLLAMLLDEILSALPSLLAAGFQLILSLVQGLLESTPDIIGAAASLVGDLLSAFAERLPDLLAQGISMAGKLIAGLISMIPDIIVASSEITTNIIMAIMETDWNQLGVDIVLGIAKGIANARSTLIQAAVDAAISAFNAAKQALGIRSPSRLFRDEVGYRMPQGAALGVYDGIPLLDRAMDDMAAAASGQFATRLKMQANPFGAESGGFGRQIVINQYIYSEAKTAADLMREARYEAEKAVLLGV